MENVLNVWQRTHVLPASGNCQITDFILASYHIGSNPLPHLRKEIGGKWEIAHAGRNGAGNLRPLSHEAPEGATMYVVALLNGYPRAAVYHWPK